MTLRVGNAWDHWAGSLDGITGNFEGGKPMGSLGRINGNFEGGKPMGSLGRVTGRDRWAGSLATLRAGKRLADPSSTSKEPIRLTPVRGIE